MTVRMAGKKFIALSTDVKPPAMDGSELYEEDTTRLYLMEGGIWKLDEESPHVETLNIHSDIGAPSMSDDEIRKTLETVEEAKAMAEKADEKVVVIKHGESENKQAPFLKRLSRTRFLITVLGMAVVAGWGIGYEVDPELIVGLEAALPMSYAGLETVLDRAKK